MKYRKDITNYLVSQLGDQYKKKDYKFYEQESIEQGQLKQGENMQKNT